ncbi:MAG: hypothetical protein HC857_02670 [Synechococcales cyanobacterium RU_4_20]|nr:hypothetical protein [Synechococcales cyanobacterium RU_4_20]NJR69956.1 hypothetical protein [Synechococcales cyanobacterium CRU_2_2]
MVSRPRRRTSNRYAPENLAQENFSDYVAELQLHMALQAKNLLPSMGLAQAGCLSDGRAMLLHETQAMVEKQISRQV